MKTTAILHEQHIWLIWNELFTPTVYVNNSYVSINLRESYFQVDFLYISVLPKIFGWPGGILTARSLVALIGKAIKISEPKQVFDLLVQGFSKTYLLFFCFSEPANI